MKRRRVDITGGPLLDSAEAPLRVSGAAGTEEDHNVTALLACRKEVFRKETVDCPPSKFPNVSSRALFRGSP